MEDATQELQLDQKLDPGEADARRSTPYEPPGRAAHSSITEAQLLKKAEILHACLDDASSGRLSSALVELATSEGGLLSDELRREAWPRLFGYHKRGPNSAPKAFSWQEAPRHRDEDQVELDVNRAFVYYPTDESDPQREERKRQLSQVIICVLRQYPVLCYFQGFHDIAQVCLLVLGPAEAPTALTHLCFLRIRDFMLPSLAPSLAHLQLLPVILERVDPKLRRHLSTTQPFFALPATLTMYAHDIQEYGNIARLFDFLIAQPAVVSIYFFAVIVHSRREELFDVPSDEPEMLHSILCKLPKPLNLEELIEKTVKLFSQYPPESLRGLTWWRVSTSSVLKTSRWSNMSQSVSEGELLFNKQLKELRQHEIRQKALELMWAYRRPLRGIGMAILIGAISYSLQRQGLVFTLLMQSRKFLWRILGLT